MLVRENIDFVRGVDPRTSIGVGLDVAVLDKLQRVKEVEKIISNLVVDPSYPFVYFYIDFKFLTGDLEDEENIESIKKNLQNYFKILLTKSGLDEYLDFDSQDPVDEISYKVKLPYRKIFKKIASDFNE